jgi:threonine dehydratase
MKSKALQLIRTLFKETPLELNSNLSKKHNTNIFLKREDLTPVRSYKIRGAFNKMSSLINKNPIVTCSAGNHAQGVAYSCDRLQIYGTIFMPTITPEQKIQKVKQFGKDSIKIELVGNNFDESFKEAKEFSIQNCQEFIHPFDDAQVIEGQTTVGEEIITQMNGKHIDTIILPVGGGGLAAGVSEYIKNVSPSTKIIGVEPLGAPSMTESLNKNRVITLDKIDTFVDGASVKKVGELNFHICRKYLDKMILIDEGHVCSKIIQMYNENGCIIEPAGVLSLCALDVLDVYNTNVVCIVSGGNSDVFRMPEILERALIYENKKHYFRIEFPQKAGALKNFVQNILGSKDDIIYFRYTKLINKEMGPVIIGIETEFITELLRKMKEHNITFEKLDSTSIY